MTRDFSSNSLFTLESVYDGSDGLMFVCGSPYNNKADKEARVS